MNGSDLPPGAPPVVNIDGEKIRRLREVKGLTQLYVATSVGVTTDTISRWENRRYPTIKKENALKLAEALEVSLAEIEDTATKEAPPMTEEATPTTVPPARNGPHPVWFALSAVGIVLLALLAWYFFRPAEEGVVTANRLLPRHSAPGQIFPVLIQLDNKDAQDRSLILKESFPAGCQALNHGVPPVTALDPDRRFLKWISKAPGGRSVFAYLARLQPDSAAGQRFSFAGEVTLRRGAAGARPVTGPDTLEAKPLHWADGNGDSVIDDEEILAVYDIYGAIEGLDIDKEMIDEIWSATGYRWDREKQQFIALP